MPQTVLFMGLYFCEYNGYNNRNKFREKFHKINAYHTHIHATLITEFL